MDSSMSSRPHTAPPRSLHGDLYTPSITKRPQSRGSVGIMKRKVYDEKRELKTNIFVLESTDFDYSSAPSKPDVWRSIPVPLTGSLPPMKENSAAILYGEKSVYMFGGIGMGEKLTRYNALAKLDIESMTWSIIKTLSTTPQARSLHAMCLVGDSIWVHGGEGVFSGKCGSNRARTPREVFSDHWVYHIPSNSWSCLPVVGAPPNKLIPHARRGHTATCLSNQNVLIFGGCGPEPIRGRDTYVNELWLWNATTLLWEEVGTHGTPPSPRAYHTATLIDETMWVIGGASEETTFSDVYFLNTGSMTWSRLDIISKPSIPLCSHVACPNFWYPNKLYIYGGKVSAESGSCGKVLELDVKAKTLSEREVIGAKPGGRSGHLAVGIPERKEMLIIGGTAISASSISKPPSPPSIADLGSLKGHYLPLETFILKMQKPPMKAGYEEMRRMASSGITSVEILNKMEKWKASSVINNLPKSKKKSCDSTSGGPRCSLNISLDVKTHVATNVVDLSLEGKRITKPLCYSEFKSYAGKAPAGLQSGTSIILEQKSRKNKQEGALGDDSNELSEGDYFIAIPPDPMGVAWEEEEFELANPELFNSTNDLTTMDERGKLDNSSLYKFTPGTFSPITEPPSSPYGPSGSYSVMEHPSHQLTSISISGRPMTAPPASRIKWQSDYHSSSPQLLRMNSPIVEKESTSKASNMTLSRKKTSPISPMAIDRRLNKREVSNAAMNSLVKDKARESHRMQIISGVTGDKLEIGKPTKLVGDLPSAWRFPTLLSSSVATSFYPDG